MTAQTMILAEHPKLMSAKDQLFCHTLYAQVNSLERLRVFMEAHVFAVWDFMSLLKRLQRELTCVSLPWAPLGDYESARLINSIVLEEESDVGPDGKSASHLELYLQAMEEVGASTDQLKVFIEQMANGVSAEEALNSCDAPSYVKVFVQQTLDVATKGSLDEAMCFFFFGREDVIPEMFTRLLAALGPQFNAPYFRYYLQRHIELDSGEHGPAAENMLMRHLGGARERASLAVDAAVRAIHARTEFFSAIEETIVGR